MKVWNVNLLEQLLLFISIEIYLKERISYMRNKFEIYLFENLSQKVFSFFNLNEIYVFKKISFINFLDRYEFV